MPPSLFPPLNITRVLTTVAAAAVAVAFGWSGPAPTPSLSTSAANPQTTGGLTVWLDATDATTLSLSGQEVLQWNDKSGNLHHASPASAADRPSLVAAGINGLPTVRFDLDPMNLAGNLGIAGGQDRTVIAVMNYSALVNNNELIGTGTNAMIDVGTFSQSQRLRLRDDTPSGDGNIYSGAGTFPTGTSLLTVRALSPAGTVAERNGAPLINDSGSFQHFAMGSNVQVGGANFGSRAYRGDLSELLVFNRALTNTELNDVGHALQQKYGVAGAFTAPAQLGVTNGLQLWLDANDATTLIMSGNEVTQWSDKSGNNHHAVALDSAKRPQLNYDVIGGRPALAFNRDQLTVAGGLPIGAGDERTIFMVFDYDTLTQNSELFGTSTAAMIDVGTHNPDGFPPPRDERLRLRQGGDNFYTEAGTLPLGSHILTVVADANGTRAWNADGLLIDDPGFFQHYNLDGANLGIGGALFNNREFIGDLAEVLVYDRALGLDEINLVGAYLGDKYSLAFSPVPEPGRALLAGFGALFLLLGRRRRTAP